MKIVRVFIGNIGLVLRVFLLVSTSFCLVLKGLQGFRLCKILAVFLEGLTLILDCFAGGEL